jgi:hypothetical protein
MFRPTSFAIVLRTFIANVRTSRLVLTERLACPKGGIALAAHLLKHRVRGFNRWHRRRTYPPSFDPSVHKEMAARRCVRQVCGALA